MIQRQYHDKSSVLADALAQSLMYHRLLAVLDGPRLIDVFRFHSPLVRICSDASFEPEL